MTTIDIVAGLGEIGIPMLKLFSKNNVVLGYDVNQNLMDIEKFKKFRNFPIKFLHICIPFSNKFPSNIKKLYKKFNPQIIVIHSTVAPYTTQTLQKKFSIPVIYSATRGVHKRMLNDIKKYTKFFALEKNSPNKRWATNEFRKLLKNCNVKTEKMSTPITLELAKLIVDTTYYGWLINFAQLSNLVAKKYNIDYDEMWEFSKEIHKNLGNRPKMFPGFIGGHCVIPNLSLINEDDFFKIDKINNLYAKKVKNSKSIAKKYTKGKQSYSIK